ncbi:hypothetical protein OE88DRAFT_1657492 [Heliocybe sulcata]|uniref:Uncharacterized protein n=1 Tax=Heliocybe sulcata TaxID=5364 RepID=A0A5C3N4G9_9AGAM|nr:hypothetical protein OE88DRAFT_1657492 [Heliocybe sulcata]
MVSSESSREQPLPHSAQSPTFLDLSLSSSSESLVSASSDEGLKIALPLNAMQPPKRATHPRSPSFTPHTPALRPRMNRADSVISYFSLSIGSSTPSTPVDRTPTATPDRERKRKVQNVSKVSRTLGECPKTVVEGIAGKKAPDGQVVIRKESRSLELASRGGDKLASVPQRDVLSDTEAARPPAFAKMNVGRKWIRERGSRYYVEEDYEVIRSTLRMLR